MKSYTVKQLSEILETNPETIRRWIKSGQLEATQSSRKEGNVVTEEALSKFVEKKPKYATALVAGAALLPLVPFGGLLGATLVGGGLIAASNEKEKNKKINKKETIRVINIAISESMKKIQDKQNSIAKIQKDLEKEQEKILKLQNFIKNERRKNE